MIPLAIPHLAGNEERYLQECVQTNFVSSVGPFVDRFETQVAEAAGARGAVATSSGTSALHAALLSVGVGRDDLVIAPSFTFIATVNAVAHCGARPWLVDVDEQSWTLDPAGLRDALSQGRKVAAIVPVYTLGTPARMDEIVALARQHCIPVVADAAAALGATWDGRPSGALGATLSTYSFNGNKTITAGGGGAVVGDDEALLGQVRHLTTTARVDGDYTYDRVGYNYRLTNLQAAVGCAQLEQLQSHVGRKRAIARRYAKELLEAGDLPGISSFPVPERARSGCWFSGVLLDRPAEAVVAALRERGVGARPFWKPAHLQAPFADCLRGPLPVTEGIWRRVLTLPCSVGLTDDDQARVIDAVRAVLG